LHFWENIYLLASSAHHFFASFEQHFLGHHLSNISVCISGSWATFLFASWQHLNILQGQVVTAILAPGNAAFLSHLNYTGSAEITLQGR
jgi:hypothetical protein